MKLIKDMLDSIDGDERFVMTLGAGVVNMLLLCFGYIDPMIYRDLTLGTVAVFIGASAWTASAKIKADGGEDVPPP